MGGSNELSVAHLENTSNKHLFPTTPTEDENLSQSFTEAEETCAIFSKSVTHVLADVRKVEQATAISDDTQVSFLYRRSGLRIKKVDKFCSAFSLGFQLMKYWAVASN